MYTLLIRYKCLQMFHYINTNIGHHLTMFQMHTLSTLLVHVLQAPTVVFEKEVSSILGATHGVHMECSTMNEPDAEDNQETSGGGTSLPFAPTHGQFLCYKTY
ncbi:uncharacterized protein LOC113317523 isoform X2 [Papaver somniferum]|uniref:uncharacterized protein LOC113317523 isoform X2 n=1 Tax=Papaver somniferum TaxID=3469 RepID=UPI000E702FEF|nr:uncharacterized protein LOC113317523 isoform X2 [Papaver somniferum]